MTDSKLLALIADLDGVVTRTARVHARAWREMFDAFLEEYGAEHSGTFTPFSEEDYRAYVDGKPRLDGVRDFLQARGIELPEGSADDPPGRWTIRGLGRRKNALFREALERDGVEVFERNAATLRAWHGRGMATALVSSSKNARYILARAGLQDAFDVVVDGTDSAAQGLEGKPAPDIYLQAAERLGVAPGEALVIEDARAGVEAGCRGGFGLVVGVGEESEALRSAGADSVVADLTQLPVERFAVSAPARALDAIDTLLRQWGGRKPALFLDYDGTLTPIVDDPDAAWLAAPMRERLAELARRTFVAVISGRDLADVRRRVGLDQVYYAGSHGFDIRGPGGVHAVAESARQYLGELDSAEQSLRRRLEPIRGVLFERKRFSLAVHVRRVSTDAQERVERAVNGAAAEHGLRTHAGKAVLELQPPVDWDKGRAVRWLMAAAAVDREDFIPIYIGDDRTDEDAFRVLAADGLGIIVAAEPGVTLAGYRLSGVDEVADLLERIASRIELGAGE